MADIFNRNIAVAGVYTADRAIMSLGTDLNGMLVTSVNATYNQPVNRIVALNGDAGAKIQAYYVVGNPQGQATIQQIIGPKKITEEVYKKLANPCNGANADSPNNITFTYYTYDCNTSGADKISASSQSTRTLKYVIGTSISMGVSSNDMMINEGISVQFGSMDLQSGDSK